MSFLAGLQQEEFLFWVEQAREKALIGQVPGYIPLLENVKSDQFALYIVTLDGASKSFGNLDLSFPLMSVIKPFLLLYLLSYLGTEAIFKKVGDQPSDLPFNSLQQLQDDHGFPRNPMINSGAITLASLLPGNDAPQACENLRLWLNQYANCQLLLDELMLDSVRSLPNYRNQGLLQELSAKGFIENPDFALNTYNYICCLAGNVVDLAHLGLLLVNPPHPVQVEHCQIVQELMQTCGLYESSKEFAQRVGFPTKSGVSGAVLSIIPNQGAIACYSPPLDQQGNSVAGLFLIEKIANIYYNLNTKNTQYDT